MSTVVPTGWVSFWVALIGEGEVTLGSFQKFVPVFGGILEIL
jgi:hypothetical protein